MPRRSPGIYTLPDGTVLTVDRTGAAWRRVAGTETSEPWPEAPLPSSGEIYRPLPDVPKKFR
jgi:hypothetical protein